MFSAFNVVLKFDRYIAEPYWPEMNDVIEIEKRAWGAVRSEDKRQQALARYLEKEGLPADHYENLKQLAARPWYLTDAGFIFIPRHQVSATLVHACTQAPAGARVPREQLRSLVMVSDFLTHKRPEDAKQFRRYVRPSDAKTGKPISNQRSLRVSQYIDDFEVAGQIEINVNDTKWQTIKDLITFAGKYVGCGASRKMGYGRFALAKFEESR